MSSLDLTAVKDCFLFAGMTAEDLRLLGGVFQERQLAEGMTVFSENMAGESLYIVHTGTIRVSKMISEADEKTLVILGPEEVFGEMALLDGAPRSATARVVESALLLCLAKADFDRFCEQHPELGLKFLKNLVRVFCRKVRGNENDYRAMLLWAAERRQPSGKPA